MNRLLFLLAALSSGAAFGCAGAETSAADERLVFVGAAADSDVRVGAVRRGDAFTLYACGGADDFATRTHWFSGTVVDEALIVATPDGWSASGEWTPSGAHGTIVPPDDEALSWSVEEIESGSTAGLYGGEDSGCRTGVVVTPGAPGVQGTWCDAAGDAAQVTPIRAVDARGFLVGATTPIGLRQLRAVPIDPR